MSDKSIQSLVEALKLQQQQQAEQQKFLAEQQKQQAQQFQALLNALVAQPQVQNVPVVDQKPQLISLHKDLSERMEKFVFEADENKTFDKWYARYQTIFDVNAATMTNAEKVCLLTEKLSTSDYDKFANTILPLSNATVPFAEAVTTLKRIFGLKESLFSLRYQCLKVKKEDCESFAEFGARVNLHCEKFDIAHITAEDFKVLVFVKGLQASQDTLALSKLLTKLDQQEAQQAAATEAAPAPPKLTLQEAVNLSTQRKTWCQRKQQVETKFWLFKRSHHGEKTNQRKDFTTLATQGRNLGHLLPPAACVRAITGLWIVLFKINNATHATKLVTNQDIASLQQLSRHAEIINATLRTVKASKYKRGQFQLANSWNRRLLEKNFVYSLTPDPTGQLFRYPTGILWAHRKLSTARNRHCQRREIQ
jgi:hypothetical protein